MGDKGGGSASRTVSSIAALATRRDSPALVSRRNTLAIYFQIRTLKKLSDLISSGPQETLLTKLRTDWRTFVLASISPGVQGIIGTFESSEDRIDLVSRTSIQCILPENALEDNANQFRKGRVWESDRLNYTFENTFATTRLLRDNNRVPIIEPPGLSGKCLGSVSSNL